MVNGDRQNGRNDSLKTWRLRKKMLENGKKCFPKKYNAHQRNKMVPKEI